MRIWSNTAMSVDGKIGTFRQDHVAIGSAEDRRRMGEQRARADAVLVGGQTFRNWPLPLVEPPGMPSDRDRPVWNAVLTRQGVLGHGEAADARVAARWPDPRVRLLVIGGPAIDAGVHARRLGAEVVVLDPPSAAGAIEVLRARGCSAILVEAGGDLIFQLLEAELLDEMHLTLCPVVIGGASAPTPAGGRGFDADHLRMLELKYTERIGDELFLRYNVHKAPGAAGDAHARRSRNHVPPGT